MNKSDTKPSIQTGLHGEELFLLSFLADEAAEITEHLRHAVFCGLKLAGVLPGDAQVFGLLGGVNVGSLEDELPVVHALLVLDHLFDLGTIVFPAAVFHSVGGDDKDDLVRAFGFGSAGDAPVYIRDGLADRVQEGCRASHKVLPGGQVGIFGIHSVPEDFILVVKQDGGEQSVLVIGHLRG